MKTVLVTGASRGIGAECVRMLRAHGFRVFAGVRDPAQARAIEQGDDPALLPVRVDVTDEQVLHAARATIEEVVGDEGLHGLVNNAGILISAPVESVSLATLREQFEVNTVGQVAATQAMLPVIRTGRGRIVMMSSVAGFTPIPYTGAYCASKYALEALSACLRMELAPWAIPVSLIQPAAIGTGLWDTALERAPRDGAGGEVEALHAARIERQREHILRDMRSGIAPAQVARAVLCALTARRPRARYGVGLDVLIARLGALAPPAVLDWYMRRRFGL